VYKGKSWAFEEEFEIYDLKERIVLDYVEDIADDIA
jgi:hypothetical protein